MRARRLGCACRVDLVVHRRHRDRVQGTGKHRAVATATAVETALA